jgi:hypothetical protein
MRGISSDNHSAQAGRLILINSSFSETARWKRCVTRAIFAAVYGKQDDGRPAESWAPHALDIIAAKIFRFVIASPQSLADDVAHRHQ